MEQLSIFEYQPPGRSPEATPQLKPPPRARRDDPVSSKLAAARAGDLARDHQARILEALERANGTIYELAQRTGLTHVQVARRLPELAKCAPPQACATDETRLSPSGRPCRVWAPWNR